MTTRVRYAVLLAVLYAACLLAGGMIRHAGKPEAFPLPFQGSVRDTAGTFNPGASTLLSWARWNAVTSGDFLPLLDAARRRADGRPMYVPEKLEEGVAAFVYTPLAALLVAPLASASNARASDVVSIANHALALAAAALLFRVVFRSRRVNLFDVGLFALHVLLFYPLARALELTQAGVWILFFFAVAAWLFDGGRTRAAGVALAVGASIKPHLVLILILLGFVPGEPRKAALAGAFGLVGTGLVCLGYAGFENCWAYVTDVVPKLSASYAYFANQSFQGLLLRLFTDQAPGVFDLAEPVTWIRVTANLLGLGLLAATAFALRGASTTREGSRAALALAMASVVVASPVCWIHHYAMLAPSLALAAGVCIGRPELRVPRVAFPLLAGGVVLSFFFDSHGLGSGWAALGTGLELYGALLFLASLVLLIRLDRAATKPR